MSRSQDSSVGMATGYWLDGQVQFLVGLEFLLHSVQIGSRPTQIPIQWEQGTLFSGVKRPGSEADHSSPSSAEVKNGSAIPPLPHMSSRCGT
jgi:hypothetical protein